MITITPTMFEMFDDGAAHVEIKTLVDDKTWPALSEAVHKALSQMFAKP
jgi:hypothetical protein